MKRLLGLVALVLALTGPAVAETRQFGNIIYSPPPDWRVSNPKDGILTLFSELPNDLCEYCRIYLGAGRIGGGKITTFLKSQRKTFVDEDDHGEIQIVAPPQEVTLGNRPAAIMGLKTRRNFLILFAVALDDRFELLAFRGYGRDEEDLKEGMEVFRQKVEPFFASLTYVSDGASSLLPEPTPGDLTGIWMGWSTYWMAGMDGILQMKVRYHRLVLWPDGHFYDGSPPDGLAPINRTALIQAGVTEFGVYETTRKGLKLTYADGRTKTLPSEGKGWTDDEATLEPVEHLEDGARIEGVVSSFFYSGFSPGSGINGGVSSSSYTEFRKDGTYSGSRHTGTSGNFDTGGGFATSGNTGSDGRYEIKDGLIIRYPKDGSEPSRAMIVRYNDDIMIGDQPLDTN